MDKNQDSQIERAVDELRPSEDAEERLQQSQRLEAIGRLAGGVAHDMNNVLGAIMGLASLLPEEIAAVEAGDGSRLRNISQAVAEILAASQRGRDLTRNLLGFARKGTCRIETLAIGALVNEVAELLRRTADKQVEIRVNLDPRPMNVEGDATQLHQALMNLCINALDAMEGGGALTLATRLRELGHGVRPPSPHLRPGLYAELTVADTGHGMDRAVLERAFEPFFTTKALGQGTGLGLSMVYGTVRNHNGAVALTSVPTLGTTATVYLPLSLAEITRARSPSAELRLHLAQPALRGEDPQQVLLVDDEAIIRSAGRRLLTRLGFTVVVAESGPEALALYAARRGDIALVLLDLSMPGMDGVETLRRLLLMDPAAKVLLCSGFSQERVPKELLASGNVGFLRKPFDLEDLSHHLRPLTR